MRNNGKQAFKFMINSGGEKHRKKVELGFINAFNKGYSPIEITRIAGAKSAKYIHSVLVKSGLVLSGKPGRQSKKLVLPESLEAVLRIRGLSFAQWRTGWGLEEHEVIEGIESREGKAVDAFRRDFPKFYCELTGSKELVEVASGPEYESPVFVVDYSWDKNLDAYCAEIKAMGIRTYGETYQSAFYTALMQRKDLIALSRLETLPSIL